MSLSSAHFQSSARPRSCVSARLREMSDLHCPVSEEKVTTVIVHLISSWKVCAYHLRSAGWKGCVASVRVRQPTSRTPDFWDKRVDSPCDTSSPIFGMESLQAKSQIKTMCSKLEINKSRTWQLQFEIKL